MKKTKITKTTYQLTSTEIMIALRNYIKKTLRLSDAIDENGVALQPILGEETELIGAELTFTDYKESR